MKIHTGFISNSSSSSYIIFKKKLTNEQIDIIKNHYERAPEFEQLYGAPGRYICDGMSINDKWVIRENEEFLDARTYMDNFDLGLFLTDLGLKSGIDFKETMDNIFEWENYEDEEEEGYLND